MNDKGKNRIAFAVILMLAAMCILYLAFSGGGRTEAVHAEISHDGEVIDRIDLDTAQDRVFLLQEETGRAVTLEVKDGAIRFVSSDCPDHICVNTGFIRRESESAVCLPNRIAVVITAD